MPTLNNWSVTLEPDPFLAPELRRPVLQGRVHEHPDFDNGTRILTTPIVAVEAGQVVTLSGSRYELGTVDPQYEAQFPPARERLLASYAKEPRP